MGYFSLFEVRLALYEIFDFVKIVGVTAQKSRTRKTSAASPKTDNETEANRGSDYFFCFSWVSGFFAPASALVFS